MPFLVPLTENEENLQPFTGVFRESPELFETRALPGGGFETFYWANNSSLEDATAGVRRFDRDGTLTDEITFDMSGLAEGPAGRSPTLSDSDNFNDPENLVSLPDGSYFLNWMDYLEDPFRVKGDVFGARFASDGSQIGSVVTLFEAAPRVQEDYLETSAILLENGNLAIAAPRFGAEPAAVIRIFSPGMTLLHETVIPSDEADTSRPTLRSLDLSPQAGGGFLLVDVGFTERMRTQAFDAQGTAVSAPVEVLGSGNSYFHDLSQTPLTNGSTLFLWGEEGTWDVFGRVVASDGTPVTDRFQINTTTYDYQQNPRAVALPDGEFYVAWIDYGGAAIPVGAPFDPEPAVRGRLYDGAGTPLTEEEIVVEWEEPDRLGGDEGPLPLGLTALEDGRVLLEYESLTRPGPSRQIFQIVSNETIIGDAGDNILTGGLGDDLLIGEDPGDLSETEGAQVYRIYKATLDRAPDTGGFERWTDALESNERSLLGVVTGFVGSTEFREVYGDLTDNDFVTLLYQNVLDRAPDADGLDAWIDRLSDGTGREQVVVGFSESAEFKENTAIEASVYADALDGRARSAMMDDVFRLYQATLDRAPDPAGLDGWSTRLADGRPYVEVAAGFTASTEFRAIYGDLDDTAFVERLYRNVLDREADGAGLQGWLERIGDGDTREDVVRGFAQSREFIGSTDATFEAYMKTGGGTLLDGGAGDDTLYSRATADTFVFDAGEDGTDIVLQVDTWDTLRFEGFGYEDATDALAKMRAAGPDVRFDDQGVEIVFAGVDLATLQQADFFLA